MLYMFSTITVVFGVFLQGKCVLTVELDDNEACPSDQGEEEEDTAEFYLLFSGSTQRHLTSTIQVSHVTLQAVCPGKTLSTYGFFPLGLPLGLPSCPNWAWHTCIGCTDPKC